MTVLSVLSLQLLLLLLTVVLLSQLHMYVMIRLLM